MNWKIKILIGLALLALVIIVAVQNSAPVDMDFLFWRATVDRLLLFAVIFLAGVLNGVLFSWIWRRRREP